MKSTYCTCSSKVHSICASFHSPHMNAKQICTYMYIIRSTHLTTHEYNIHVYTCTCALMTYEKLYFKPTSCILQFQSNYEIRKVKAPTLFLSGLQDQLIPPQMMMELYQVGVWEGSHVGPLGVKSEWCAGSLNCLQLVW